MANMKLIDVIEQVKEKNLTIEQIEAYRDQLVALYAQMCIEMADIQKSKAIFIDGYVADSDIAKKRKWQITEKGLREIELKGYITATKEIISSLKSRIYSKII